MIQNRESPPSENSGWRETLGQAASWVMLGTKSTCTCSSAAGVGSLKGITWNFSSSKLLLTSVSGSLRFLWPPLNLSVCPVSARDSRVQLWSQLVSHGFYSSVCLKYGWCWASLLEGLENAYGLL